MLEEGLDVVALKKLDLPKKAAPDLKNWNTFLRNQNTQHITIGLIKYVEMQDCYKSILRPLFMQELQMRLK
jgi:CTP synthase